MRLSRAFAPTLKEAPSDVASTPFATLARAGFVRGRGDVLLPLGIRLFDAVVGVFVAEMEAIGSEAIALAAQAAPSAASREIASLDLVRRDVRSFRELPRLFHRVDAGGRSPLARSLVVDAFAADDERALGDELLAALGRAFDVLTLTPLRVADGEGRLAFHVEGDGDAPVLACDRCAHVMLASSAVGRAVPVGATASSRELARVHTPNVGSVEAVASFLAAPKEAVLKSIVHVTDDGRVILAVVRGDHTVNPALVARASSATSVRLASDDVVRESTGAAVGFAGPIGFTGTILVDRSAAEVDAAIVGANATDHHYVGAQRGRDWNGEIVDLRTVSPGDACPRCDGSLRAREGAVVARLASLGVRPATALGVTVTHEDQTRRPVTSTSLVVDLAALFAVLARACSHADGLRLPWAITPYPVHVVALGRDEPVLSEAARIYDGVRAAGIAVSLDDRDERAGVKFKDADLLGGVVRVTVGAKALANGNVEVKRRGGELELWRTDDVVARLVALRPRGV